MNWEQIIGRLSGFQNPGPAQLALICVGTFLATSLVVYLVGKLVLGIGRNQLPQDEAVGSRRPLALGKLTEAFAGLFPITAGRRDKLRKELMQAGYYHRKAFEEFVGVRNAALVAWLVFIGAAAVAIAEPGENLTPKLMIAGTIVLIVVYAVPRLILSTLAHARRQRIQFALPDALDMINMTVTGGLPLRPAFQRVSNEIRGTHPDIACELAIINLQSETGSLELALKQFANRIDVPDVAALAAMVRHAEKLGGQVATAFGDFSDGIRRTRRQQAEERGNKSSIKLLFPIVFLLAPPIYILLLGPAVIELKNFAQRETAPGGVLAQQSAASVQQVYRGPNAVGALSNPSGPAPLPTPALPSVLRNRRSR